MAKSEQELLLEIRRLQEQLSEAKQALDPIRHEDLTYCGDHKGWWADTGMPMEAEEWALARAAPTQERAEHRASHCTGD